MERKRRVLLVEDEESQATVYARAIARDGFDVDVVYNADEAAQYLDDRVYEVAVVDMSLSGIDGDTSGGEQVLAHARTVEEPPALVVFTGIDRPQFAADTIQEWRVARFVSKDEVARHGSEPLLHGVRTALAVVKPATDRRKELLRVLAGGELEDIWVDRLLRTLNPHDGYPGLMSFLAELFAGLTPLLPKRDVPGLQLEGERETAHFAGDFWSKGIGAPVFVAVRSAKKREGRAMARREDTESPESTVHECERNGLQGAVWKITGNSRTAYGS